MFAFNYYKIILIYYRNINKINMNNHQSRDKRKDTNQEDQIFDDKTESMNFGSRVKANIRSTQNLVSQKNIIKLNNRRIVPKNITQQKQMLYQQNIRLKQSLHESQELMLKLKTRLSVVQRQRQRIPQQNNSFMSFTTSKQTLRNQLISNNIPIKNVNHLKRMLRESKDQTIQLKNQLIKLKKDKKYTQLNEIIVQKNELTEECARLGRIIENRRVQYNSVKDQYQKRIGQLKRQIQKQKDNFKNASYQLRKALSQNQNLKQQIQQIFKSQKNIKKQYEDLKNNIALEKQVNCRKCVELGVQLKKYQQNNKKTITQPRAFEKVYGSNVINKQTRTIGIKLNQFNNSQSARNDYLRSQPTTSTNKIQRVYEKQTIKSQRLASEERSNSKSYSNKNINQQKNGLKQKRDNERIKKNQSKQQISKYNQNNSKKIQYSMKENLKKTSKQVQNQVGSMIQNIQIQKQEEMPKKLGQNAVLLKKDPKQKNSKQKEIGPKQNKNENKDGQVIDSYQQVYSQDYDNQNIEIGKKEEQKLKKNTSNQIKIKQQKNTRYQCDQDQDQQMIDEQEVDNQLMDAEEKNIQDSFQSKKTKKPIYPAAQTLKNKRVQKAKITERSEQLLQEQLNECEPQYDIQKKTSEHGQNKKIREDDKTKNKQNLQRESSSQKQVKILKQLITYRFRYQRQTYQDFASQIRNSGIKQFTYAKIIEMLAGEPFYLENQQSVQLILKYLFEKDKSDAINTNKKIKSEIFIRKIKFFIQQHQILDQDEQARLEKEVYALLKKDYKKINQAFEESQKINGRIDLLQFRKVLKQNKIKQKYIQVLLAELSMYSEQFQQINYKQLLKKIKGVRNIE